MDARCRFRVRRRPEAGGGILFPVLSFLSLCLCRRRSRRVHPDAVPVEEEGFLGCPAQLYGDAVADDVATLGSTGECSLTADTFCPHTLCDLIQMLYDYLFIKNIFLRPVSASL